MSYLQEPALQKLLEAAGSRKIPFLFYIVLQPFQIRLGVFPEVEKKWRQRERCETEHTQMIKCVLTAFCRNQMMVRSGATLILQEAAMDNID